MRSLRDEKAKLIERAVRGVTNADGEVDANLAWHCDKASGRGLFFSPLMGRLHGISAQLLHALNSGLVAANHPPPGRGLAVQAYLGQEAVSLDGLLSLKFGIQLARDEFGGIPGQENLVSELRARFPDPEVFGPNTIEHALRSVDPAELSQLLRALAPEMSSRQLSAKLFAGTALARSPMARGTVDLFLEKLEKGYGKGGWLKLTDMSAHLLYSRLKTIDEQNLLPSFEVFAPIDAEAGPRNGQVSRALRSSFGNLMP